MKRVKPGRNWKKWAEEKGLLKWFQKDNLIVLVLMGILLVIIALPTKSSRTGERADNIEENNTGSLKEESTGEGSGLWLFSGTGSLGTGAEQSGTGEKGESLSGNGETADADREYASYLEERLTDTLSQMADVGKVRVMITLKSSRELVVEKEESVNRSTTNENDSQGGSRIVSQMDSKENTVYRTEGNTSEPYVVMILPPQIEGVVVVAEGAGNGTVNRTIVEIVQALFDVEAHKVRVVPMNSG